MTEPRTVAGRALLDKQIKSLGPGQHPFTRDERARAISRIEAEASQIDVDKLARALRTIIAKAYEAEP
jgi:hypothetical protein